MAVGFSRLHPQRRQRSTSPSIPAWPVCTTTTRTSSRRGHTAVRGAPCAHSVASLERVWRATASCTRVSATRAASDCAKGWAATNFYVPFSFSLCYLSPCRFVSTRRVLAAAHPQGRPPGPRSPRHALAGAIPFHAPREKHIRPRAAEPPRVWQERAGRSPAAESPIASASGMTLGTSPRASGWSGRSVMISTHPSPPQAPPPDTRTAPYRHRAGRRRP